MNRNHSRDNALARGKDILFFMFRRQNLNIPLHKGAFLASQKASEVLTRAFQMTQVGFEFVQVDKPIGLSV
jgi:hypothetical protein